MFINSEYILFQSINRSVAVRIIGTPVFILQLAVTSTAIWAK